MKEKINSIEKCGIILLIVSLGISTLWGSVHAFFPMLFTILLLIIAEGYKALHWNEYRKENKRNLYILLAIIVLAIMMRIGGI
ncbi:MAG: hypothetical protein K6F74_00660 [Prevotella sp.]|nr:hypothetical protein [Prevotella sp.]